MEREFAFRFGDVHIIGQVINDAVGELNLWLEKANTAKLRRIQCVR